MKRLIPLLLAAVVLLWGCDAQRIAKLEEGVSTEADVRAQFGEPKQILEAADGSKVLSYPRQPEGWTNYQIVIGTDGKLASLRQLLTPENFAKVQPGMTQDEVRRLLGQHAKLMSYAMKPTEQVMRWHFMAGQSKKVFDVTFDAERRVIGSQMADDERETLAGGK